MPSIFMRMSSRATILPCRDRTVLEKIGGTERGGLPRSVRQMSVLTFYINRAGKNLSTQRKGKLEAAKSELRRMFGRKDG